jgi:glucosamine-6-phosphate deaminase
MPDLTDRLHIYPDAEAVGRMAAEVTEAWVRANPHRALGLATGATIEPYYKALSSIFWLNRVKPPGERLTFSQTPCFNLDDYRLRIGSPHSYSLFMNKHFYIHVDCPKKLRFIPYAGPGTDQLIAEEAKQYERQIVAAGGIGLQILGLGGLENEAGSFPVRGAHIGFNEAGSDPLSRTRLVTLAESTRKAAVKDFGSLDSVPKQAVTMGVGTIMEAGEILVLVTGDHKAWAARATLETEPTPGLTATILHNHPRVRWCLDEAAASKLSPRTIAQATRHTKNELFGGGPGTRKLATLRPA